MEGLIKFLTEIGKLKRVRRTGWVMRGVHDPEAVSGHMYRMSIIAMVTNLPGDMDRNKCMKMCLVHDMAECVVGDIAPCDNVPKEEKKRMEEEAMNDLCKLIENEQIRKEMLDLFHEYEDQSSCEAILVKDIDRFEMILQAKEYEDQGMGRGKLQEFFDGVKGKFKTDVVKKLVEELERERLEKAV